MPNNIRDGNISCQNANNIHNAKTMLVVIKINKIHEQRTLQQRTFVPFSLYNM